MRSWCLGMLKGCFVFSSMRLGVPFIAPRQLGAVESIPGRQFLPSVDWRTGQSGAPRLKHTFMLVFTLSIIWHRLTHDHLCWHSITKILRNGPRAHFPFKHSRTKHIDIRYHFLRNHQQRGDIEIAYVSTKEQLADIFTKPLDEKTFSKLRNELNILDSRNFD
jgi:hypothetical protein